MKNDEKFKFEDLQSFQGKGLQLLLDTAKDGAWITDSQGHVKYVNSAYCKLTGYSEEEILKMSIWDFEAIETSDDTLRHIENIMRSGYDRFETIHRYRDGSVVDTEVTVSVIEIENEQFFLAFMRDLSVTRQIERRKNAVNVLLKLFVRKSSIKEYLSSLVDLIIHWSECSSAGIRIMSESGELPYEVFAGFLEEFCASENLLSINEGQCISCICYKVFTGKAKSYYAHYMTEFGSFYCNNIVEFVRELPEEERVKCRETCIRHGVNSISVIPIRYRGNHIGLIHVADKKPGKVSSELVELIESLSGFIGEALHKFNIEEELRRNCDTQTVINSLLSLSLKDLSMEEIFAHAIEEILSISWLSFESRGCIFLVEDEHLVMKAQKGLNKELLRQCARIHFGMCLCGRAALTKELQFADSLDERHEISYEGIIPHGHYCVPILFLDRVLGVINIYVKHGHRMRPEEKEFLKSIANILAMIIQNKKSNEEKEKLHNQLLQSQKMEAIGTLAGGIAHDFNNILTAIMGYADLALMKIDEGDLLHRELMKIRNSSVRAGNLTRQMLLFSRKQPMDFFALNINKTITELLKMLERLIGEDITIETLLMENLWTVKADEGNIEQVIMNLVINARDAMPHGGVLTIKTENVSLDGIHCKDMPEARAGDFVSISVKDTGSGIDNDTISHIFEPFFTTKESGKGTGLGLAVVYGIVSQHDGWINVQTKPGQGTVFTFYIPAFFKKTISKEVREKISAKNFMGKGERILLVEDDAELRNLVAAILSKNGYSIFVADNIKDAMDIFDRENGNFHMVLSDVVMPDGNGIDLVTGLRLLKPGLPVLLVSGYTDEKSQWTIIKEKGFHYLQKPFSVIDILQTVDKIIKSK